MERVQELKYNPTKIRREILQKSNLSTEVKIVKCIDDCMTHQVAFPKSEVKEKLQKIYDDLALS
jgi:hypothetical protein